MNLGIALLAAVCVMSPLISGAQQTVESQSPNASLKPLSVPVESIIASEQDGYHALAYIVRWHGTRVLLTRPPVQPRLSVGDNANIIVSHHDVAGKKLLSFIFTSTQECNCELKPHPAISPTDISGGAESTTGVVEEVLSAEDSGYRSIGYVVQAQGGTQIAVEDPIAQTHYAVGDNISLLALRMQLKGTGTLNFMALPDSNMLNLAVAQTPSTLPQAGMIAEVLSKSDNGYGYRAYIIESQGTRVAVQDATGTNSLLMGDPVSLVAARIPDSRSPDQGVLHFFLAESEGSGGADSSGTKVGFSNATAAVEEILTTHIDGYRYIAYVVTWNGSRVAIPDMEASSQYTVGQHIRFVVSRADVSGERQLSFTLVNFTKSLRSVQKTAASVE